MVVLEQILRSIKLKICPGALAPKIGLEQIRGKICALCTPLHVRPSQVNSLFLVIFLSENLPSLQQKKKKRGSEKNELIDSVILTFCFKGVPINSHAQFKACRKNIHTPGKDLFMFIQCWSKVSHI